MVLTTESLWNCQMTSQYMEEKIRCTEEKNKTKTVHIADMFYTCTKYLP